MDLSEVASDVESKPLFSIVVERIDGRPASLGDYAGKVLLVVNVASKCGLTPQYEGLEALYSRYRDQGLVVLGFPANNFKEQEPEPGTNEQIDAFCRSVYGVDFPMFGRVSVAGTGQAPLYRLLTEAGLPRQLPANPPKHALDARDGKPVRWNFEKFLVSGSGAIVGRFDPDMVPGDPVLVAAIERERPDRARGTTLAGHPSGVTSGAVKGRVQLERRRDRNFLLIPARALRLIGLSSRPNMSYSDMNKGPGHAVHGGFRGRLRGGSGAPADLDLRGDCRRHMGL